MTTQALTLNTILGNISLSDPSEIDTTQPFPETVGADVHARRHHRRVWASRIHRRCLHRPRRTEAAGI